MARQQFSARVKKREILPVPPDDKLIEKTAKQDTLLTIKTEQQIFKIFTRR